MRPDRSAGNRTLIQLTKNANVNDTTTARHPTTRWSATHWPRHYIGYAWAAGPPFITFESALACNTHLLPNAQKDTSVNRFHVCDDVPLMTATSCVDLASLATRAASESSLLTHVKGHEVDFDAKTVTLGPWLEIDRDNEYFVNNEQANEIVEGFYRAFAVMNKKERTTHSD